MGADRDDRFLPHLGLAPTFHVRAGRQRRRWPATAGRLSAPNSSTRVRCGFMTEANVEPVSTRPAPDLEPVAEDWQRALCVVAHPDDLEFGAAAAVARWTGQGKTVVYAMVTSGEAGIDGLDPEECRRVREAEQVESARVVGVPVVEFLGLPDGVLEYGVPLRRAIAQVVRRHRPDIVITGNFRDTWGGRNLNQADHIAVGRAVVDAVRDAGNRWVFPEQLSDDVEPWGGVRQVW